MGVETARLHLRPLTEADLDELVDLDGFAEVRTAVDPFGELIPQDAAARREYERTFLAREGFLAAFEGPVGRFVGWFQLEPDSERPAELELGYRLRPDAWGRGLASEGAAALLADALTREDVVRVYAHALLSNAGSIRVMEKIGMSYAAPWSYRGLVGAEYEARPPDGADATPGPRSAPAKRP